MEQQACLKCFLPKYGELCEKECTTRIWANAQRDDRPAEHRWRPLFNAPKFS